MRSPESPNEARAAGASNRPKSSRTGEADPCGLRTNLSLPTLYGEILAVATCFVFGGWLGLPAAMHFLRRRPEELARHPEEAANDDRFEA